MLYLIEKLSRVVLETANKECRMHNVHKFYGLEFRESFFSLPLHHPQTALIGLHSWTVVLFSSVLVCFSWVRFGSVLFSAN